MFIALFDYLILFFKITLLSFLYTAVLILLLHLIAINVKSEWLNRQLGFSYRNWLLTPFLICIALFVYANSYWQDTGAGEWPLLPVGYGQHIYCPDYQQAFFFPDLNDNELNKEKEIPIENFLVSKQFLCAEGADNINGSKDFEYIVFNLSNSQAELFSNRSHYNKYAKLNKLPAANELKDFRSNLYDFLNKKSSWQKWLLP